MPSGFVLCADDFALTEGVSRSIPALRDLARAAATSLVARREIAAEIGRQLDAFEDRLGRPPDFIDGHQHVHVLPGVRRGLLDAVASRYAAGSVYLRDPADSAAAIRARGVAVLSLIHL